MSKNEEFCIKNEELYFERRGLCIKNEELCIKNDELCFERRELCIKNDELCIKNDELCRFVLWMTENQELEVIHF